MTQTIAIARRELQAFFTTAVGYVVIALFLFVAGFLFTSDSLIPGAEATMNTFFGTTLFLLMFIVPAISMRLISEEMRLGTLESLMTCPVSDMQLVIGKWIGGFVFLLAMLAPTLLFVALLAIYSRPDYGSIVAQYAGLLLVGGLYLAFGTMASAVWPSQILSYLVSVFFWLIFMGVTNWLPQYVSDKWAHVLYWMSINLKYQNDFGKGVIDTSTMVYFISGIVLFLIVAIKIVESRRWR